MHHNGHFLCQSLLEHTATGICVMLCDDGIYLFLLKGSENLNITLSVLIWHIEPELVEDVWGSIIAVEPNIAALCLAKLLAVTLCHERTSESEALFAVHAAYELRTCSDIAPLVGTAKLEFAVFVLVEIVEIIALQQLVGKLGEGESVARFAVETLLHTFLSHHVVDGDVLANVTHEVEEAEILHPVIIVDKLSLIRGITVKIEEA